MNSLSNLTPTYTNLFFGKGGSGLARHDIARYEIFKKQDEKMKSFFWQPNEVDMSGEKASFNKMTEAEKFVFTSNLRRQILLDSIQGRAPSLAFLPVCTDPQLEACIQTWSFFEQIHSISYGHIIRAIYPDPEEVFDGIPAITEIANCANSVGAAYDNLITNPTKENLYLALISANALEALRFYVSFACTFSFAERGSVEASAKIVKFVARDEACLHPDTEVLTGRGWVPILDVTKSDLVAQMSLETSQITYAKPLKLIAKDYNGDMVRVTQGSNDRCYQNITIDHDLVLTHYNNKKSVFTGTKKLRVDKAKFNCFNYIPVSGVVSSSENLASTLTPPQRLAIAVQADGSFSDRYTGVLCGTIPCKIFISRQRKIERLDEILSKCEYLFTKEAYRNGYTYKINLPKDTFIDKDFEWVNVSTVDTNWCQEFMAELVEWDGHKPIDADYLYYSNTNESAVSKVQEVLALSGYKHRRGVQEDTRQESYKLIYSIYWWTTKTLGFCSGMISTQNLNKDIYHYEGVVGCLTMPEGTLITRYKGNVNITGNCHLALVTTILKTLPEDDPDFIQIANDNNAKAISMFEEAAEQERVWVDYLFSKGTVLGLNEKVLNQYIDHLLSKRMYSAGLIKARTHNQNPLPWIDKWFSNSNVQVAPQEVEISSYLTGSVVNDLSEAKFSF